MTWKDAIPILAVLVAITAGIVIPLVNRAKTRTEDALKAVRADADSEIRELKDDLKALSKKLGEIDTSIRERISGLERKLDVLETKIDVFWRNMAVDAAMSLHSPHPEMARRDYLLEQFIDDALTTSEADELMAAMNLVRMGSGSTADRMAAAYVYHILKLAKFDREAGV